MKEYFDTELKALIYFIEKKGKRYRDINTKALDMESLIEDFEKLVVFDIDKQKYFLL